MDKPAPEKIKVTVYMRPSEAKRIRIAAVTADMTLSDFVTAAALRFVREVAPEEG